MCSIAKQWEQKERHSTDIKPSQVVVVVAVEEARIAKHTLTQKGKLPSKAFLY